MPNTEKEIKTYEYNIGEEFMVNDKNMIYQGLSDEGYEFIDTADQSSVYLTQQETVRIFNEARFRENNEKVKAAFNTINNGFDESFSSPDKFRAYLDGMANLRDKSARNVMLILQQNEGATIVNSMDTWNQKYHRGIKKGEKALSVLEPVYRNVKDEAGKAHKEFTGYYNMVNMFDASQLSKPFSFKPPFKSMSADERAEFINNSLQIAIYTDKGKLRTNDTRLMFMQIAGKNPRSEQHSIGLYGSGEFEGIKFAEYNPQDFIKEAAAYVAAKTLELNTAGYEFSNLAFIAKSPTEVKAAIADSIKAATNTIMRELNRVSPELFHKPKPKMEKAENQEKTTESLVLDTCTAHVETPIGIFNITSMSLEEMKKLGFNELYNMSDPATDLKYHIVTNGKANFAVETKEKEIDNQSKEALSDKIEQAKNRADKENTKTKEQTNISEKNKNISIE